MEPVGVVAVPALHKDGALAEALCEDLPTYVEQVHALPDMPARILDGGVAVDVGEEAEAEPVGAGGGVSEAIHHHVGLVGVERFPYAIVEFVVRNGAPKGWFLVLHLHRGAI